MTVNLRKKGTGELTKQCFEEQARFHSRKAGTAGACLELFRRAVEEESQPAWEAVYQQFHAQVLRWSSNNPDQAEDIAHEAWEKFMNSVTPEMFPSFAGVGMVLSYLRRCVRSVMIDRSRFREREQCILEARAALKAVAGRGNPTSSLGMLDAVMYEGLAEDVYSRLQDAQELLVVRLSFELDFKPREIAGRHPEHFPTARHVSRVKERVIRRLSSDPVLRKKYLLEE